MRPVGEDPAVAATYDTDPERLCGDLATCKRQPCHGPDIRARDQGRFCEQIEGAFYQAHVRVARAEIELARALRQRPSGSQRSHDVWIQELRRKVAALRQQAKNLHPGRCYRELVTRPNDFTAFDARLACEPEQPDRVLSLMAPAKAAALVSVARNACLVRARQAERTMHDKRAVAAESQPLEFIRSLPPSERLPAEAARIQQCRDSAAAKRAERVASASTRPVDELRAIPDRYRVPEEEAAIKKADEERLALLQRRTREAKWAGPVLSAAICIASGHKRDAAGEIRTEYQYAKRYGGMIDKGKIYGLQQSIREYDEEISDLRAGLRQARARPLGCRSVPTRAIVQCIEEGRDSPSCKDAKIREYMDLVDHLR